MFGGLAGIFNLTTVVTDCEVSIDRCVMEAENCAVAVGGLVATTFTTNEPADYIAIEGCSVDMDLTLRTTSDTYYGISAGGIMAFSGDTTLVDGCVTTGSIKVEGGAHHMDPDIYDTFGGMFGSIYNGEVSGCSSDMEIEAGCGYIGGIAGEVDEGLGIQGSAYTGSISIREGATDEPLLHTAVGGLMGTVSEDNGFSNSVSDCYMGGTIDAPAGITVGLLMGTADAYVPVTNTLYRDDGVHPEVGNGPAPAGCASDAGMTPAQIAAALGGGFLVNPDGSVSADTGFALVTFSLLPGDAAVTVDGAAGYGDGDTVRLSSGNHEFVCSANGYVTERVTLQVAGAATVAFELGRVPPLAVDDEDDEGHVHVAGDADDGGDSVTTVACAAAGVVAALMAVFLVVDGRRR